MKFIISILITIVYVTNLSSAKIEAPKCCDNVGNTILESQCDVDKKGQHPPIKLDCEEKYILDPQEFEEDNYTITENGTLLITDMQTILFRNEFCLVNKHENDEIYEVAIVCFPDEEIPSIPHHLKAFFLITSIVFLLLTLYIYYILPELRETQDKVMIFNLVCQVLFMFFLTSLQLYNPSEFDFDFCVLIAFLTFFFTISYFAWLNCVILNVWKIIVLRKWKINETSWYHLNHLYAWSVPIILTTVLIVKHSIKPTLGVTSCWFHSNSDQWGLLYIPISVMLFLNAVFCIWSSIYLKTSEYTPDTLKALRYKCILYLKIFLLGGFTWCFEVLSYTFNNHSPSAWVWVIVDTLNCLHGILVFCVLIIWRQRIRKELAGRKILCYTCPNEWANIDDEEQVCLENEGKGKYDLVIKAIK